MDVAPPDYIGGRREGSLVPHKGKERLVAFDAKLGPKDIISVGTVQKRDACEAPPTTNVRGLRMHVTLIGRSAI